jgi:hypothetical protein
MMAAKSSHAFLMRDIRPIGFGYADQQRSSSMDGALTPDAVGLKLKTNVKEHPSSALAHA